MQIAATLLYSNAAETPAPMSHQMRVNVAPSDQIEFRIKVFEFGTLREISTTFVFTSDVEQARVEGERIFKIHRRYSRKIFVGAERAKPFDSIFIQNYRGTQPANQFI